MSDPERPISSLRIWRRRAKMRLKKALNLKTIVKNGHVMSLPELIGIYFKKWMRKPCI